MANRTADSIDRARLKPRAAAVALLAALTLAPVKAQPCELEEASKADLESGFLAEFSQHIGPCRFDPDREVRIAAIELLAEAHFVVEAEEDRRQIRSMLEKFPDCTLSTARRSYELGRFEVIPSLVRSCRHSPVPAERFEGQELLAKTYEVLGNDPKARRAIKILLLFSSDYEPRTEDRERFRMMVAEVKEARAGVVSSVSKTRELLREAPATVVVITAEQIERRGYTDLEQVFHDLPGFDISRGNGDVYSNLYQRGFRSNTTDRTLFLLDGVEQNDLHSNVAYISRQYPLSNVERIEVIYGPASTMYGANAYTGVINVITREPGADLAYGKALGAKIHLGAGSFESRAVDFTLEGKSQDARFGWSLTGRSFRSDEQDLSGFPEWDYESDFPDSLFEGSGYSAGEILNIRRLEQGLLESLEVDDSASFAFSDPTDDWFVYGKLRIADVLVGAQLWSRDEGSTPWYTELLAAGTGNDLTPKQAAFFLRFDRAIGTDLALSLFTRFKRHELSGESSTARYGLYSNGFYSQADLRSGDAPRLPFLETTDLDQVSSQFRTEATLVYEPSDIFNVVVGLDLRESSIQTDFVSEVGQVDFREEGCFVVAGQCTNEPRAGFAGEARRSELRATDLGLFAQATYRPWRPLKVVAGIRADDNELRESGFGPSGFGTVFNSRLAFIYTRGDLVAKLIYAEAFKDASNLQRFTRAPGSRELTNPALEPEEVENLELSASWSPSENLSLELAAYEAIYSNSVVLVPAILDLGEEGTRPTAQFTNLGSLEIRGVEASATWISGWLELSGNVTMTDPYDVEPRDADGKTIPGVSRRRVGDIADLRANLALNAALYGGRLNLNLRANHAGERPTGEGTTVATNTELARVTQGIADPAEDFSYTVVNGALTWRPNAAGGSYGTWPRKILRGSALQLAVGNIFDAEYYHPGVQLAGDQFAARLPQPGRTVFLRWLF